MRSVFICLRLKQWAANYWVANGCPPSKLVVGMAMYGRGYKLANPSIHGMGAPAQGPSSRGRHTEEDGFLAYYEVCAYTCVNIVIWEIICLQIRTVCLKISTCSRHNNDRTYKCLSKVIQLRDCTSVCFNGAML